jgi:hypothetical protein
MPLIRCPHCGEDTFAITGWGAPGHCASCGRPLGGHRIKLGPAVRAGRRLPPKGAVSAPEKRDDKRSPSAGAGRSSRSDARMP